MQEGRENRRAILPGMAGLLAFAVFCSAACADPIGLSLSGSLNSSRVNGVTVGAGTYTTEQLSHVASAVGTVTASGFTGVSLWGLLGGNSTGSTSDVVTDLGKNAILRSYLLATNSSGSQFVISLGQVDPFFGGTATNSPLIAFAGGNGNPALIFPSQGAAGRDVADLTSLQVLSVPAPTAGPGGPSTSFLLTGDVSAPGTYSLADLQSRPSRTQTVGGDTYTGVSLWNFLGANTSNEFSEYVLAEGTDGYEVLFSLAELDPGLGAPNDLIPYADTGGQFPADGFARVVIPGDNHAGRYVSNLSLLEVTSIPEPSTVVLLCLGILSCAAQRRLRPGIRPHS